MRIVKSFADVQKILNEILDWKASLGSKSLDLHGNRITNAGASIDANDYVTKAEIPVPNVVSPGDPHVFTIVYSNDSVSDGYIFPPYVAGKDRSGYAQDTWVVGLTNLTQPCTVQFAIDGNNLLDAPLLIKIGQKGPIHSSNFVSSIPKIGLSSVVVCTVVTAGDISGFSAGIVVNRQN